MVSPNIYIKAIDGTIEVKDIKRTKSPYFKKKGETGFYRDSKYIYSYKMKFPGKQQIHSSWIPANNRQELEQYFTKFFKKREVKKMPKGKGKGPGRPKKRGRPKGSGKKAPVKKKPMTPKERLLAKAATGKRVSLAEVQQKQAMISRKPPTSSIMMHGAKYTLHDKTARTKVEAQKVRQKLKAQGMAAFINPRKRKAGTQWFVYKKPRVKVAQPVKQKVSKRTGVPTGSINMHGKKYDLYDSKPRTKAQAQAVRKRLAAAGKSAFLNPRRRKSGTEYFIYTKQAERKRKTPPKRKPGRPRKPSPKRKPSPRKKTAPKSRDAIIKELEAELRRIKALD